MSRTSEFFWRNSYEPVQPWAQFLGYAPAVTVFAIDQEALLWPAVALAAGWTAVIVTVTLLAVLRAKSRFQVPSKSI